MQTLTHPSNPPADAIDFSTQQSDGFEIANWMQASKPNVQNTQDTAYKVVKLGDRYLVVWAGRMPAKVNMNTLKKGTRYKQFDTDDYNYVIVGNYPTYIKYRVDVEGSRILTHPKAFPAIMVTVIKK